MLRSLSVPLVEGTLPAGNFVRNRNELPAGKRPGIILLDGDEAGDPRTPPVQSGRNTAVATRMIQMTPELYIVLDDRKPGNKNVGEDLSLVRQAIVRALLENRNLQLLVGSNGNIVYNGCVSDLARNRAMEGQMGLLFTFLYPFIPFEIAGLS